jgi:cyanophycinase-like exopeptidase
MRPSFLIFLASLLALCGSAGQPVAASPCTSVTVFPTYGKYAPSGKLHGPALLLDGGGALEAPSASLLWAHDLLAGTLGFRPRFGNVVVLRAYDTSIYDKPFYQYGYFSSVQTIRIAPCSTVAAIDAVVPLIDRADAVFFAGGDQANYVVWKNTALIAAVRRVYARGGIVGGGSAGLAVQGAVIFDSVTADQRDRIVTTPNAVRDPFEDIISFTTNFFAWPALADTITDTHFVVRDRFGRSVVFLARILHDGLLPGARDVYALGIDEASSVVVGPDGIATLFNAPGGKGAYLLRGTPPDPLTHDGPILYTVAVSHVARSGERFDLLHKRTADGWYSITVDGSKHPPYSSNPYRN